MAMLAPVEPRIPPPTSDGALLFLAELNHRVCNELQVAASALRVARRGLQPAETTRLIDEAAARMEAFGCVHRILDRQRGYGTLAQRLAALCHATAQAKAAAQGIHLTLKLQDVNVDDETAWTVCVVASELMTNAFKHAFADGSPGSICVELRQDGAAVLLTVADDGRKGARAGDTVWQAPGFGTGIVTRLAERLGGYVTRLHGPTGAVATLCVPADRALAAGEVRTNGCE
jgi:two-component sensor histidine kinase